TEIDTAVKAELQTSTVEAIRGSAVATGYTDFKLNGEWFAETTGASYSVATAEVNDTIEYVTLGGVVFYAKIVDVAATTKNIAMIITADTVSGDGDNNQLGSPVVKAKLLLADGSKTTVTVDKVTTITGTPAAPVPASVDVTTLAQLNAYYGKLVTYRVDADGNYELTLVNGQNMAGYKSYASGAAYSNKTIAGAELADDATVFVLIDSDYNGTAVFDATNNGKIYTGKEFKNQYGTGTFGYAGEGYALVNMVDGFNYAKVAMVISTSTPTITTGTNYGYLTEVANRTVENDKTYLNVTMWTEDGEVTAKFESTDAPELYKKGAVITYDDKADGEIKNVSLVSLTDAAVIGWSESTGKIQLSTGLTSEVTKDTVVIYVDSKNGKGAEGGSIQIGQDSDNDDVADVKNVRYVGTSTAMNLLIVDVNNLMYANPVSGKVVATSGMTAAAIESMVETELNSFSSTTADLSAITNAPFIDVKAGQTLTIDGLSANAITTVNLESGASLNVSTADLKNLNVTGTSGANVTLNGVKLAGTGAALTGTTALSVNATGAITATGVTAVDTTKLGADKVTMAVPGLTLNNQALGTVLSSASGNITVSRDTLAFSVAPTIADAQTLTFNGTIIGADPAGTAITLAHTASGGKLALNGVEFTTSSGSNNTVTFDKDGAVSNIGTAVTVTGTTATSAVNVSSTTAVALTTAATGNTITATLANGGKVTADTLTYTAGADGATVKVTNGASAVDVTGTLTVAAASASKTINVNSGTLTATAPSASNTLTVNLKSGAALKSGTETYTAVTDAQVTVAHTSGDVTLVSGSVKLSNGAVISYAGATFTATSANDVVALNGTTVTTTGAVTVVMTNASANVTVKATKGVITADTNSTLRLDSSNTTEVTFAYTSSGTSGVISTAGATSAATVVLTGANTVNKTSDTWSVALGANTTFVGANASTTLTITNATSTAGAGMNFFVGADKTQLDKVNNARNATSGTTYTWQTNLGASGNLFSGWYSAS
ncbi:beta strand repeat-containing protein, partial [Pseudoflavonifractor phocaeensis]|uniref:beta strand repeat-containing protein n=1 Tax=Pseudoflavonifractor phocaeensis TaxID=1870988 RepID=UPI0019581DB5